MYPTFMTAFLYRSFTLEDFKFQLLALLYGHFYLIPTIYFITYYLIPKLLHKKRIALFIILSLFILVFLTIIDDLSNIYIFMPKYSPEYVESFKENVAFKFKHLYIIGILLFTQLILFITIKLLKEYFINFFEKQLLKQQIADSELKVLKSQLHPHFLFNTLNNIYSLSLDCNDSLVPQSIERISSILRYSLYECNNGLVSLTGEIQIIKDYIELERIRYTKIEIDTTFPNNVCTIYIMPLLLFAFVENAFKHGTSNAIKNKWINLNLSIVNEILFFKISNSKNPNIQTNLNNYKEGIGLKNALKRLELYYGSDNFTFIKNDLNTSYEIELSINLNHKN